MKIDDIFKNQQEVTSLRRWPLIFFIWKGRERITGDKNPKRREKKKKSAVKPFAEQIVSPEPELIKKQKKKQ